MNKPADILKKYWNFDSFRAPQEAIIQSVLENRDTVVLLPTGGGKSLCFQIPAMIQEGVCIVISPLIALIQDQVNSLLDKNIKAIALTSRMTREETIVAFDNLQYGDYRFLYLSPEKLQNPFIQEKIKQLHVSIVAIDEAHCISEWGHDFRPSYLQLNILKQCYPEASFVALTATATQRVLKDIQVQLGLDNAQVFKKSFRRNNLVYKVIHTEDMYGNLLGLLRQFHESVVIYTTNRKQTKELCTFLKRNKFKSSFYHGGLSLTEKNTAYTNWMEGLTPIMVATNAFGMGIDKPDVRAVIHVSVPASLENFIQEAGRAGRDGKKSYSIVLTNESIIDDTQTRFKSTLASVDYVKKVYGHLNQYFAIAIGESPLNLFDFSLQEFCHTYQLNILQTYNAIKILERENVISLDENYRKKSTLKFLLKGSSLFDYLDSHTSTSDLINLILRSYGGVFEHYTIINEYRLAKILRIPKGDVIQSLKELHRQKVVHYTYENTSSKLSFLIPREDQYTIHRISKNIKQQNILKLEKLRSSLAFIQQSDTCRNRGLLSYFNETLDSPCGICDVCMSKTTTGKLRQSVLDQITELLSDESLSSKELTYRLNYSKEEVLNSLKILLEKNKIAITSQNKYKITG